MKKNLFLFVMLGLPVLYACQNDSSVNEQVDVKRPDVSYSVLDSLDIYNLQTDKSVMINQLIRFQSGKFLLDLSEDDAEKIGISKTMYKQVVGNVSRLNNSNLKMN